MAWSADFLAYIRGNRAAEVWRVSVIDGYHEPGGDGWQIASCAGFGNATLIGGPPTISGARLTPGSWSSTCGTCTVPLRGDIADARWHFTRGTLVAVELGRPVGAGYVFERVHWGAVWQITGAADAYEMEIRDPIQTLGSRLDTQSPALFATTSATQLSADVAAADTTLNVDSTTAWLWDQDGSGIGCVLVEDELITFTGTTATTFTGCGRGAFGSTAADHADNTAVTGVVYLYGHPLSIARRLILSHPDAGNSAWDDYPPSWGLAVPQTLVDLEDIEAHADMVTAASGYNWSIVHQDGPVETGLGWLIERLARGGFFVTMRQGQLTVRAGMMPLITMTTPPLVGTLTERDLEAGVEMVVTEAFGAEAEAEALTVTIESESDETTTGATGDGAATATLPAVREVRYNVTDLVRSNEAEVRTEMSNRLALFHLRVPEAVQAPGAGMGLAELAPGDVVYLETARAGVRLTYDHSGGRRCLVTQVSPDWAEHRVMVRLLAYPSTHYEWDNS